ncbi:uncharacterized protein LOC121761495 isoform X2 [Salvia splendens]|uniref:uncharacterized protein LOC121761495 isoform X2 n=1 Tax=Salvia splendens TaxID=180675 RepID=UPI001C27C108|nr:uncharacterized protein LOC121761495 isoform X2 [Salvia splendens]
MKTIKLFGSSLPAKQHDDQDTITTNDDASRKRKFSPNQEEDDDDDHSFIPKKPKLCDDGEEGEDAVPPSDFHPVSVTTGEDDEGEETVHPLSSVTTDEAILGKRKSSFNQEEEDDDDDDSFIPKKPKLATESPNPEEAVPPRMLAKGSSIQEEDYDLSLSTKPRMFKLFGVYISIDDQEGHTVIQNPNQDDQAPIQNPNQEEEEEEEEEAPDPPEGNDLVFMFEKELTSTDVARNQNRLLITKRTSLRLMAALTEEERGRVEVNGGDNLRVVTTDPNGVEYILKLKRWAGSSALVLKHEWGKLVRANGLQMGDSVVGWGYRVDDEFRLFLYIIKNQFN